jgi:hypothetical protein
LNHHQPLFVVAILICSFVRAQDSSRVQLPATYLQKVSNRVDDLEKKLEGKSEKALRHFQKSEERIYKKFSRLDSTKAAQFLATSKQQYAALEQKLSNKSELTQYWRIDTNSMKAQNWKVRSSVMELA